MLSTFRSAHWLRPLLLPLAFLCLTVTLVACGGSTPSTGDAETEATTDAPAPAEAQEPAQFRDGFESGDTSGWSGEGDGEASEDDATTSDSPPAGDG